MAYFDAVFRLSWPTGLCLLLGPLATLDAQATEVISAAPEKIEVVIYSSAVEFSGDIGDGGPQSGVAMIRETRTVDLPAGVSTLKLIGTAESIIPQTAALEELPGQVTETNFNFDLMGPGELLSKSIGASVHLYRTDKNTGKVTEHSAILRAAPEGIVLEVDGKLTALNCNDPNEKIVFDSIPPTLMAKPTLAVTVTTQEAGRYPLTLSYLVSGLRWRANYVARLNAHANTLDLGAWITLSNQLETTFVDAPVHVMAGDIAFDPSVTMAPPVHSLPVQTNCWRSGRFVGPKTRQSSLAMPMPSPYALEEIAVTAQKRVAMVELGDLKFYTLPEPTTIAARQTKQVRLLDQHAVTFSRIYGFNLREEPDVADTANATTITLRLTNDKKSGLGIPLPGGVVSVFQPDPAGIDVLAGEQGIGNTPIGATVEIPVALSQAVWVQSRVLSDVHYPNAQSAQHRLQVEAQIGNDKDEAVTVELNERSPRIVQESDHHHPVSGKTRWSFTLQAGERRRLVYTVETRPSQDE